MAGRFPGSVKIKEMHQTCTMLSLVVKLSICYSRPQCQLVGLDSRVNLACECECACLLQMR